MTSSNPEKQTPSVSPRRENRIAAMQFLYMLELNKPTDLNDSIRAFFENRDHPRDFYAFAEELIQGALSKLSEVDEIIRLNAENWTFNRIAKVDLAILRLAIYELLFRTDIPPIVSINEAIDLSKNFSDAESKRFVNGILDKVKGSLNRPLRKAVD